MGGHSEVITSPRRGTVSAVQLALLNLANKVWLRHRSGLISEHLQELARLLCIAHCFSSARKMTERGPKEVH